MFCGEQPLPPNTYDPCNQAIVYHAYEQCLTMQTAAGDEGNDLIHARCLGYLIRELPERGSLAVASAVISCNSDFAEMKTLSVMYINHVFRLFRGYKEPTLSPDFPSTPRYHEIPRTNAVPVPQDHQTAKRWGLIRDNYRCVATGVQDTRALFSRSMSKEERARYNLREEDYMGSTNYCEIFPSLPTYDSLGYDERHDYIRAQRYILDACGFLNEVVGENLHSLKNGITLTLSLAYAFRVLHLWFEVVPEQINTYRVETLGNLATIESGRIVTFTSSDDRLPVPDPRALELHATICRVAKLSGVTAYMWLENYHLENTGHLAEDGSSANLLASRLTGLTCS